MVRIFRVHFFPLELAGVFSVVINFHKISEFRSILLRHPAQHAK